MTVSHQEALANLAKNIAEAKARQEVEDAKRAREDEERPAPPHPDAEWRERGRRVFIRMLHLGFEHAPWHHPDAYAHAASTFAGREWLEKEIVFWESRMTWHEKQVIATRARKPLDAQDADPMTRKRRREQEDDWALIGEEPLSRQLERRERAEDEGDGFGRAGRTARVDQRAIERRDALIVRVESSMRSIGAQWARRDSKTKYHAYDGVWRSICGGSVLLPDQQTRAIIADTTPSTTSRCSRCEIILQERGPHAAPSARKPLVMK